MHSFGTSIGMGARGIVGGYLFDFSGSYFVPFMTSSMLGLIATGYAAQLALLKAPGAPAQEKGLAVETAVGTDVQTRIH
jgi:hypothetical protein